MRHLKEEFDKLSFKETLMFTLAAGCIVAGFTLLFVGMFIPPEGQIHESVIAAFGIILLFVGAVLGIDMHYSGKTEDFKKSIMEYVAAVMDKRKLERKEP